jgi:hypothetical protein
MFIIVSALEVLAVSITIYFLFNEYKLINFEDKIKEKIKNFLR